MTSTTSTAITTATASRTGTGSAAQRGPRRRPPVTPELLAALAGRLTSRDRWLLGMLAEHRVLTTAQITALGFRARRHTERRLAALRAWRCLDRFRPHTPIGGGSAPYHWVLDDAGAAVLAATHGLPAAEIPRQLGFRRATALAIAHCQRLDHTIGTNTLLTALATSTDKGHSGQPAAGLRAAGQLVAGQLTSWWGERRCAAAWGDLARPDAAGAWCTPAGRTLGFAVEYDTGSEPLARVAGKLADYADLAAALGGVLPVLFWLPSIGREAALHRQLDPTGLLVATAAAEHAEHAATACGPAGPVWRPADRHAVWRGRSSLDQLTDAWASAGALTVLGGAADGLGWPAPDPRPPLPADVAHSGHRPWGS